MIASPNHSARGSAAVRLVVGHTAEGARNRTDLGRYFQGPVDASSHVGIDGSGIEQYVPYDRSAWTLLNGNPISDNAELCGFARWTRDTWLSTGVVDGVSNPRAMLNNFAAWVRERCNARGIPIRKLTPSQVDQGMSGVIGHVDWSLSNVGQGDHSDPGAGFPWDYVINLAQGGDDDMTPDEMKWNVLASNDFRFDGRNPIDMWRETVNTGFRIEAKLDAIEGKLSDDEANIIAVFRQGQSGLDPEQQAELIKGQVNEAVWLAVARLARDA